MTDVLVMPISDLHELSGKLNDASDRVNGVLRDAEERLQKLNLGIEVGSPSILYNNSYRDKQENVQVIQRLSWGRYKGTWKLLLKTVKLRHGFFQGDDNSPYCDTESVACDPILEANRDLRFAAVGHLESLISEIKKTGKEMLEAAEKASKIEV